MTTMTMTPTAECPYLDIREAAEQAGLTEIELITDNNKTGDARVAVYRVGDVLVAGTNGNSVWREDDGEAFDALLADEGITL